MASYNDLQVHAALADDIELNYTFWPFGDEIIAENARVFTEQYGVKVSLQPTSGDYASVIETKLVSGTHLDLFRAQRGQASRWFAAQWIRSIDDMPDLDKIKREEFPGISADAVSWPDHKRIGLTYYNGGPYCLFRNEKVLSAGGYDATANTSDYPQTWDEIYKQAVDLKKKGIVETPDPADLVQVVDRHPVGALRTLRLRRRQARRRRHEVHLRPRYPDTEGSIRLETVVGRGTRAARHPDLAGAADG